MDASRQDRPSTACSPAPRTHLRRIGLIAATALLTTIVPCRSDSVDDCARHDFAFSAMQAAVRDSGFDRPIEIKSGDPSWPSGVPEFERFECLSAKPGGWVETSPGERLPYVTDSPLEWRAVTDCKSRRLYKLYGFGVSEFGQVIRDSGVRLEGDGVTALLLAKYYAERIYPSARTADVPKNEFEVERFAENALYEAAVPPARAKREVKRWLDRSRRELESALEKSESIAESGGWMVRIVVVLRAHAPRLTATQPRLELRVLTCRVGGAEPFALTSDQLIAHLELRND